MSVAKKRKLTYIHHDPNTPEQWREFLVQWYAEGLIALEKEGVIQKIMESKGAPT